MAFTNERLNDIFDKTDGRCHVCHKQLAFKSYNAFTRRGAWEVDHSVPKARGGTDHLNNLFAACISCNRQKRDASTSSARRASGQTRAPYSLERKERIRNGNTATGAVSGAIAGATVAGPLGAVIGGVAGAVLGRTWRVPT